MRTQFLSPSLLFQNYSWTEIYARIYRFVMQLSPLPFRTKSMYTPEQNYCSVPLSLRSSHCVNRPK